MISIMRYWWGRPDHYELISNFLANRHLLVFARFSTALYFAAMGVIAFLALKSPAGPTDPTMRVLSVVCGCCLIAAAAVGAVRWPSRRSSLLLVLFGTLGISYNCVSFSDPRNGLIGCIAFAPVVGFMAFFHVSRYTAITVGIGLATAGACTYRYAASGDYAGALCALIVITLALVGVPMKFKISGHVLDDMTVDSDTDELTGLLNRRGFSRAAVELISSARATGHTRVGIIMIDIDKFKLVNDTHGHAAGDRLLITTAEILAKAASPERAIAARYGGEEFVVAAALGATALADLAEQIRLDIEALPDAVTVSVGVADAPLGRPWLVDELLRRLVDGSDQAMYLAKHAGGNRLVHHVDRAG